ncbi:MAG: hypothetical protein H0U74_15030 [Bradymonadaceae bacterium]|nr:hypothetical protein [Lujinxingiaceae bacterium]
MIDNAQLVPQLIAANLIDELDLERAHSLADGAGLSLYEALIAHSLIDEHTLVRVASKILNVPSVHLRNQELDRQTAHLVTGTLAVRNRILPLRLLEEDTILLLAMADPFDVVAMDEIASHTGVNIRPVLVGPADLEEAHARVYKLDEDAVLSADAEIFAELEEISDSNFNGLEPAAEGAQADSWAAFFDGAQGDGGGEESSVISQDMRDRPPTDVFEAVNPDDLQDNDLSVLNALNLAARPDSPKSTRISLDDWELDDAFDEPDQHKPAPLLSEDSVVSDADDAPQPSAGDPPTRELSGSHLARIQVKRIAVPAEKVNESAARAREDIFDFGLEGSDSSLDENTAAVEGETTDEIERLAVQMRSMGTAKSAPTPPRSLAPNQPDSTPVPTAAASNAFETAKMSAIRPSKAQFPTRKSSQTDNGVLAQIDHEALLLASVRLLIAKGYFTLAELLAETTRDD